MDSEKTIIRTNKKENPYVMIDKHFIEDTNLSWKARGLMCYLLSRPDNWQIIVNHLISQSKQDKETSLRSALKELLDNGYIERKVERDDLQRIVKWIYIIHEYPLLEISTFGKPKCRLPKSRKSSTNNILAVLSNDNILSNEIKDPPNFQNPENSDISVLNPQQNEVFTLNNLSVKYTFIQDSFNCLQFLETYPNAITNSQSFYTDLFSIRCIQKCNIKPNDWKSKMRSIKSFIEFCRDNNITISKFNQMFIDWFSKKVKWDGWDLEDFNHFHKNRYKLLKLNTVTKEDYTVPEQYKHFLAK